MADLTMTRLHEIMVVLQSVSLVFYFIDYLNKDRQVHRLAVGLLSIVWLLQTVFLVMYMIEMKRFPILSLFEGIYFYAWLIILLSLIMQLVFKSDLPGFFLNIIGFIFMTIHTFAPSQLEQSPVGDALRSELLFIHITFAFLAYAAFALSFVFSVLYLILYRVLKQKKWTKQFTRLPSLQHTETGMTTSIITGIPLLFVSLVLGLQWAYISLNEFSIFDFKIVNSFILLVIYIVVLLIRRRARFKGTNYAWIHVYAFLFVLINFLLGSRLSQFHLWY
ncbi:MULTISPECIES: cytochrome c biogenesis protein CcsA [Psychrobacillus]|uniref:Cytochrome c biogenesis protein CcsA n=1 Tax=Psychrobacillus faecigallinarum TaxID=2762235 RepID=A0ABR8R7U1_9BACI|nr:MULTISPECIES: cytochrome c biogenesis protein CcsA [Psychrobacillus]MBD7943715.1 cytochrome c biogenesis protein CcsA [Psychrobacillus faecigallinarum]QEY19234.1 cytochrome C assembly protein [Psychrobacillus sp. AK 1817]QGM29724.1 cytochrome C assembly protein [Bacillus sp. N3536]